MFQEALSRKIQNKLKLGSLDSNCKRENKENMCEAENAKKEGTKGRKRKLLFSLPRKGCCVTCPPWSERGGEKLNKNKNKTNEENK